MTRAKPPTRRKAPRKTPRTEVERAVAEMRAHLEILEEDGVASRIARDALDERLRALGAELQRAHVRISMMQPAVELLSRIAAVEAQEQRVAERLRGQKLLELHDLEWVQAERARLARERTVVWTAMLAWSKGDAPVAAPTTTLRRN